MEKIIGIYKFTNINNSKVYVGSSRDIYERKRSHVNELKRNDHHSFLLQRAWNKYGENCFQFEIIEILDNICKLNEREQYWIDYYDASNPDKGYNRCPIAGSTKSLIPTPETLERLRIAHLGQRPTQKAIDAAKKALTGVKHPYKARPWQLKRETRECICGCGEKFTVVKNNPKVFLNRQHQNKAKIKPREIRTCLCGCKESFEVIVTSPKLYIHSHANKVRKNLVKKI